MTLIFSNKNRILFNIENSNQLLKLAYGNRLTALLENQKLSKDDACINRRFVTKGFFMKNLVSLSFARKTKFFVEKPLGTQAKLRLTNLLLRQRFVSSATYKHHKYKPKMMRFAQRKKICSFQKKDPSFVLPIIETTPLIYRFPKVINSTIFRAKNKKIFFLEQEAICSAKLETSIPLNFFESSSPSYPVLGTPERLQNEANASTNTKLTGTPFEGKYGDRFDSPSNPPLGGTGTRRFVTKEDRDPFFGKATYKKGVKKGCIIEGDAYTGKAKSRFNIFIGNNLIHLKEKLDSLKHFAPKLRIWSFAFGSSFFFISVTSILQKQDHNRWFFSFSRNALPGLYLKSEESSWECFENIIMKYLSRKSLPYFYPNAKNLVKKIDCYKDILYLDFSESWNQQSNQNYTAVFSKFCNQSLSYKSGYDASHFSVSPLRIKAPTLFEESDVIPFVTEKNHKPITSFLPPKGGLEDDGLQIKDNALRSSLFTNRRFIQAPYKKAYVRRFRRLKVFGHSFNSHIENTLSKKNREKKEKIHFVPFSFNKGHSLVFNKNNEWMVQPWHQMHARIPPKKKIKGFSQNQISASLNLNNICLSNIQAYKDRVASENDSIPSKMSSSTPCKYKLKSTLLSSLGLKGTFYSYKHSGPKPSFCKMLTYPFIDKEINNANHQFEERVTSPNQRFDSSSNPPLQGTGTRKFVLRSQLENYRSIFLYPLEDEVINKFFSSFDSSRKCSEADKKSDLSEQALYKTPELFFDKRITGLRTKSGSLFSNNVYKSYYAKGGITNFLGPVRAFAEQKQTFCSEPLRGNKGGLEEESKQNKQIFCSEPLRGNKDNALQSPLEKETYVPVIKGDRDGFPKGFSTKNSVRLSFARKTKFFVEKPLGTRAKLRDRTIPYCKKICNPNDILKNVFYESDNFCLEPKAFQTTSKDTSFLSDFSLPFKSNFEHSSKDIAGQFLSFFQKKSINMPFFTPFLYKANPIRGPLCNSSGVPGISAKISLQKDIFEKLTVADRFSFLQQESFFKLPSTSFRDRVHAFLYQKQPNIISSERGAEMSTHGDIQFKTSRLKHGEKISSYLLLKRKTISNRFMSGYQKPEIKNLRVQVLVKGNKEDNDKKRRNRFSFTCNTALNFSIKVPPALPFYESKLKGLKSTSNLFFNEVFDLKKLALLKASRNPLTRFSLPSQNNKTDKVNTNEKISPSLTPFLPLSVAFATQKHVPGTGYKPLSKPYPVLHTYKAELSKLQRTPIKSINALKRMPYRELSLKEKSEVEPLFEQVNRTFRISPYRFTFKTLLFSNYNDYLSRPKENPVAISISPLVVDQGDEDQAIKNFWLASSPETQIKAEFAPSFDGSSKKEDLSQSQIFQKDDALQSPLGQATSFPKKEKNKEIALADSYKSSINTNEIPSVEASPLGEEEEKKGEVTKFEWLEQIRESEQLLEKRKDLQKNAYQNKKALANCLFQKKPGKIQSLLVSDRKASFFGIANLFPKRLISQDQKEISSQILRSDQDRRSMSLVENVNRENFLDQSFTFSSPPEEKTSDLLIAKDEVLQKTGCFSNFAKKSQNNIFVEDLLKSGSLYNIKKSALFGFKNKDWRNEVSYPSSQIEDVRSSLCREVSHTRARQNDTICKSRTRTCKPLSFKNTRAKRLTRQHPIYTPNRRLRLRVPKLSLSSQNGNSQARIDDLNLSSSHRWWQKRRISSNLLGAPSKRYLVMPEISTQDWRKIVEWQLKIYFLEEEKRVLQVQREALEESKLQPFFAKPSDLDKQIRAEVSNPQTLEPLFLQNSDPVQNLEHNAFQKNNLYENDDLSNTPFGGKKGNQSEANAFSKRDHSATYLNSFLIHQRETKNLFKIKKLAIYLPWTALKKSLKKPFEWPVTLLSYTSSLYPSNNKQGFPVKNFYKSPLSACATDSCFVSPIAPYFKTLPFPLSNQSKKSSLSNVLCKAELCKNLQKSITVKQLDQSPVFFSSKRKPFLFEAQTQNSYLLLHGLPLGFAIKSFFDGLYKIFGKIIISKIKNSSLSVFLLPLFFNAFGSYNPIYTFDSFKRRLKHLAGSEDTISSLSEIVWYLRNSCRGRLIPRGVVLVEKFSSESTSFLKAIGGEAQVPVIVQSLRALPFTQNHPQRQLEKVLTFAQKRAPCILFLDDLDSIGQSRTLLLKNQRFFKTPTCKSNYVSNSTSKLGSSTKNSLLSYVSYKCKAELCKKMRKNCIRMQTGFFCRKNSAGGGEKRKWKTGSKNEVSNLFGELRKQVQPSHFGLGNTNTNNTKSIYCNNQSLFGGKGKNKYNSLRLPIEDLYDILSTEKYKSSYKSKICTCDTYTNFLTKRSKQIKDDALQSPLRKATYVPVTKEDRTTKNNLQTNGLQDFSQLEEPWKQSFGVLNDDTNKSEITNKPETEKVVEQRRVDLMLRLLTVMDGISGLNGVLIVTTSKNPSSLDPALLRPGRFEKLINLKLPNKKKRISLLKWQTSKIGHVKIMPWEYFGMQTQDMTGTEIASAVNHSAFRAIIQSTVHTYSTLEYGISRLKGSYSNLCKANPVFTCFCGAKATKEGTGPMTRAYKSEIGSAKLLTNKFVRNPYKTVSGFSTQFYNSLPEEKSARESSSQISFYQAGKGLAQTLILNRREVIPSALLKGVARRNKKNSVVAKIEINNLSLIRTDFVLNSIRLYAGQAALGLYLKSIGCFKSLTRTCFFSPKGTLAKVNKGGNTCFCYAKARVGNIGFDNNFFGTPANQRFASALHGTFSYKETLQAFSTIEDITTHFHFDTKMKKEKLKVALGSLQPNLINPKFPNILYYGMGITKDVGFNKKHFCTCMPTKFSYYNMVLTCFYGAFQNCTENRELLDFLADHLIRFKVLKLHEILRISLFYY